MPTIEERLTALEARLGPEETTQATYLTIDPVTGLVSANFSGVVQAFGLILPEGGVPPFLVTGPTNEVSWQDPSGTVYADITSFRSISGLQNFVFENLCFAGGSNFGSDLRLISRATDNSQSAEIDINTDPSVPANTAILVSTEQLPKGPFTQTLIDGNGNSSYVLAADNAPVTRKLGAPVQVNRAGQPAYAAVAGWQNISVTAFGLDGVNHQSMWGQGGQAKWTAPELGFYRHEIMVNMTNNAGVTNQFVVGENSVLIYAEDYILNTLNSVLYGAQEYYMSAGTSIFPGFFVGSVAGFGVNINDIHSTFQRIA